MKNLDYLKQFPKEKQEKISELWEKFNQYEFSIIVVNKGDWEEVCEIFERINTQGQHLTVVDLMIAKTWSADMFNLREELRKFKEETGEEDLPDITILQALSLNLSGKCRRRDILALESTKVRKHWEEAIESMRRTIDFLKNNLNLPGLDLIPFPALLVPISKFFYHVGHGEPSKEQAEKIKRWFWKASIANRFDSAVETKLEEDGEKILKILENEPVEFPYSYVPRTVEDIINQKHSLRNAFTKTILCLLASQQPLNPISNSPVTAESFSRYTKSQMHHIFPQNYLQKQNIDNDLINSISNIMFLPANINKQGSFRDSPREYFTEIDNPQMDKALASHLIYDLEESGLLENDFDRFLHYRSRQILNKLKEVSGEEKISAEGRSLTPETPFTNEMYLREVIRQCERYIYWFDKYFSRRGLEFLVEEVEADKVRKIRILSGSTQTDHRLRKDFKKFQEEMNNKGVKVQMRILAGERIHDIHDRWLISENHTFNIPSINTIGRNQYAEITESPSKPPFSEWWKQGIDIVRDWNKVQKVLS